MAKSGGKRDGKRIKTVMFDQAKELTMGRMKELCDRRGIRIITSVPYSPASNGVVERMVSVMMNAVRAMLNDAGLPPGFWAEAGGSVVVAPGATSILSGIRVEKKCVRHGNPA